MAATSIDGLSGGCNARASAAEEVESTDIGKLTHFCTTVARILDGQRSLWVGFSHRQSMTRRNKCNAGWLAHGLGPATQLAANLILGLRSQLLGTALLMHWRTIQCMSGTLETDSRVLVVAFAQYGSHHVKFPREISWAQVTRQELKGRTRDRKTTR